MRIDFVQIDIITFHDLPVKHINLSFDPQLVLEITILPYREKAKDYIPTQLVFKEFDYLNFSQIELSEESDIEIFDFDYYVNKEGYFCGEMKLLTGSGKLEFNISLSCKEISVLYDSYQ